MSSCLCRPSDDLCDHCTAQIGIGEEQERERIIALLKAEAAVNLSDAEFFQGEQSLYSRAFSEAYESAIAIINGESE